METQYLVSGDGSIGHSSKLDFCLHMSTVLGSEDYRNLYLMLLK